jgi:hypothetical protein
LTPALDEEEASGIAVGLAARVGESTAQGMIAILAGASKSKVQE